MNSKSILSGIFAALLLTLPLTPALASHGWGGFGQTNEPNTQWDTKAYMWQSPNQANVEKIYFNGLIVQDCPAPACVLGGYDKNLDGNIIGPEGYFFAAVLGFWRDCNKDGYIGAKGVVPTFSSMAVYPRQGQTIDESICPSNTFYNPMNAETGAPNGFVDEFRWIAPGAGCDEYIPNCPGNPSQGAKLCLPPNQNPPTNTGLCFSTNTATTNDVNDITDNKSKVWADWNHPGGRHVYSQGLYGPLVVDGKPPGTYYDSDGTLAYVDDAVGREISKAYGPNWKTKPIVGQCNPDHTFMGGPTNGLPTGTCGAWPLYQMKRLLNDADARKGSEEEPTALATVWDTEKDDDGNGNPCDDGVRQSVDVPSPTGGGTRYWVAFPDLAPAVNPTILVDGSAVGTARHLLSGLNSTGAGKEPGACMKNPGTAGRSTGQLESNQLDSEFTHRAVADNLTWRSDQRYHTLAAYGFDHFGPSAYMGWNRDGPSGAIDGPGWFGTVGWTPRPPRHGWGSITTSYATFYADVTQEAFARNGLGATPATALPSGQDAFKYGIPEFCAAATTGPSNVNPANDWECSVDVWKAKNAKENQLQRAVIGDPYDLRDVDCFDNTVSESLAPGTRLGIGDPCKSMHP